VSTLYIIIKIFSFERMIEDLQLNLSNLQIESTNLKDSSAIYETKLNELVQISQGKQTEIENELVKRVILF
jgi:hypothetical protein